MGSYAQQYNQQKKAQKKTIRGAIVSVLLIACLVCGAIVNISAKNKIPVEPEKPVASEPAPKQTEPEDDPEPTIDEPEVIESPTDTPVSETDKKESSDDAYAEAFSGDVKVSGSLDNDKTAAPKVELTAEERANLPEVIPELVDVIIEPNYKSDYYIVVYVGTQCVVVYGKNEKGQYAVESKCFMCSTGAKSTPTEPGSYAIYMKQRWGQLNGNPETGIKHYWGQYCSAIGNGYLFHSVPYRDKGDTPRDPSMMDMSMYNKLGNRASHGCIRMCVRDCKWIFDNCDYGTQVYVTEKDGPTGDPIPALDYSGKYWGYDPSDKWTKDNPYYGGKGNPQKDDKS